MKFLLVQQVNKNWFCLKLVFLLFTNTLFEIISNLIFIFYFYIF